MHFGRVLGYGAILSLACGYPSLSVADEGQSAETVAERAVESPVGLCRCSGDLGASAARIQRVLRQPLKANGFDFAEMPLEQVAQVLQEEYGIPVEVDTLALENAGLAVDEPLTANFKNISLGAALRLMLARRQLTFVIQDEVLLITTPAAAEARLIACVYDVRDLIGDDHDGKNIAALVDAILSCVAVRSWAEHGEGEAAIKRLKPGLLVISQTRAAHDEIAELLALIRETIGQPVESQPSELPQPERGQAE